jgi:hypothetical protein
LKPFLTRVQIGVGVVAVVVNDTVCRRRTRMAHENHA